MKRSQIVSGFILAALSSVAYGSYPIFVQWILESGMNTSTILFLRFGGCVMLLWGYCLINPKKRLRGLGKAAGKLLLVGMFSYAAMSALNLAALTKISASLASMLLCLYPVFVTGIYILLGRQTFYWSLLWCLLTCAAGLYLLLDIRSGEFHAWGTILAVGASIAYAGYIVLGSTIREQMDPILRATCIMSGAWISFSITGFSTQSIQFDFLPAGWFWISCVVVIATVLPVMFFWTAIERIGAVNASIIGILEPLATVVLSALFLHEVMEFHQMIGVFLILASVFMLQFIQYRQQELRSQ